MAIWHCPDCGSELQVAMCCSPNDEWLFVCRECKVTWSAEELTEIALDKVYARQFGKWVSDTAPASAADGEAQRRG